MRIDMRTTWECPNCTSGNPLYYESCQYCDEKNKEVPNDLPSGISVVGTRGTKLTPQSEAILKLDAKVEEPKVSIPFHSWSTPKAKAMSQEERFNGVRTVLNSADKPLSAAEITRVYMNGNYSESDKLTTNQMLNLLALLGHVEKHEIKKDRFVYRRLHTIPKRGE